MRAPFSAPSAPRSISSAIMSGIATATADFVKRIAHTKARIICTRKTTPGLRALEKYAVRCGGGFNHRFGLDDAMLIKDNHIAVAGGIAAVLKRAKAAAGHLVKIEIEVDLLDQLEEVLDVGLADVVLIDNFDLDAMRRPSPWSPAALSSKPRAASRWTAPPRSPKPASIISPPARSPIRCRISISGWISRCDPPFRSAASRAIEYCSRSFAGRLQRRERSSRNSGPTLH